ncbi:hypothetical protein GCM10010412_066070 [Nonomuraea recticatena]|uniref:Secreted protein n=1 Tax=Nonomuraea recticatena TaxID=46178 RepID=A0ABN3SNA1_9ACTN
MHSTVLIAYAGVGVTAVSETVTATDASAARTACLAIRFIAILLCRMDGDRKSTRMDEFVDTSWSRVAAPPTSHGMPTATVACDIRSDVWFMHASAFGG